MKSNFLARMTIAPLLLALGGWAAAQKLPTTPPPAPASAAKVTDHVKGDIERHRAMALAHESAARCLESGKTEALCLKELQAACKGLAIGKYCGMKHEH